MRKPTLAGAVFAVAAMLPGAIGAGTGRPTVAEMNQLLGPEAREQRHVHGAVEVRVIGEGAGRVYLFLPSSPRLSGKVPVVLFHHGWQGMNPKNFGGWIDHLTRSGQVVVYPVYQESEKTSPQIVTEAAGWADKRGLDALAKERLEIDPERVVYFGYSMGAAISINLALNPERFGLPAPRAMMLAAPGDAHHVVHGPESKSIIGPIKELPPTLPVAVLTGEADTDIGLPTARLVFKQMCGIQPDRRVLMILPSDQNNGNRVNAAHGSPGAPDSRYDFALTRRSFPGQIGGRKGFEESPSMNQLDFFGYWKTLDALIDDAAPRNLPSVVFGQGTAEQLFLGTWPDGTPFKKIRLENPCPAR
ncbi:MAG TPA: dienelactone hydrolase family protein [Terriglobia bacterium]|nr:dienelactone hydrolase family protein [Terriglobia bacterium]